MEKNDLIFQQLLMSFQMQGMITMGKIMNPATQKIERNLLIAQSTIDTLEALKEKTKGNLNEEEQKLINRIIYDLKMNYADEVTREQKEKKEKKEEEAKEKKTADENKDKVDKNKEEKPNKAE
ncbi:MAG: DUF1844 domain-containing protein [Candidatus Cloacimonetes bacterium]|nr:DUF1844 domain-containing protein [Candidatus Cloacimonadota bacterium]